MNEEGDTIYAPWHKPLQSRIAGLAHVRLTTSAQKDKRMPGTMDVLIKLHIEGERQGPGSDAIAKQALDIIGFEKDIKLNVLDVGCGTGAQTIALAKYLNCNIVAVDLFDEFLNSLENRFKKSKIDDKLTTIACSMNEMSFKENTFDLIWSEGAIYNI